MYLKIAPSNDESSVEAFECGGSRIDAARSSGQKEKALDKAIAELMNSDIPHLSMENAQQLDTIKIDWV
jgi:hypothetical protein